ncbi:MAG: MaoC family dehydratase [Dehalococcoidia bacterium]|nr:MaoC family dehydratase [Dehalococcoidia bacterium]
MTENVQGIEVGTRVTFEKTITHADIAAFTALTEDTQPLHRDPQFAARTRFKHPIAHGLLCASLIGTAIGTQLAPDRVIIYVSQSLRFRAPVSPGDHLTATVTCTALDTERARVTLETMVANDAGTNVIAGEAVVVVEALA